MATVREFLEKINIDARLAFDEPLSAHTTFRIGGPADAWVEPRTEAAMSALVAALRASGLPWVVLGGGANVLASDSGFRGVVVTTRALASIERDGPVVRAGAGARVTELVAATIDASLAGLDFAAGLPGSVGGAVYMNARCYDREFADVLSAVRRLDRDGSLREDAIERGAWAYKRTPFMGGGEHDGSIVLGASFRLEPGDAAALKARARELEADRRAKGHFDHPCAGSMFKNDRGFGRPSGKILDELGFRGRRIGDAAVSEKHANIFVNLGSARAADMKALVDSARAAALEAFGFKLEPEVVFLGDFTD
ncbi:MAG: UDP-N-acetylmuramate dehydrogenase [Spirochaetales bacterium]|nr:UDP-N-acetylmuramate dehydrogenase [Spirochaetales bacterium]